MTNAFEVAVKSMPYSVVTDWVVPIITTLIGALFGAMIGAYLAFKIDRKVRDEEREECQILAAHQLLFALLQQRQNLNNLQIFVGSQEPDKLLLVAVAEILINKQGLAFVARTHPNELNGAVMAEHEYLQVIDALATFNDYTRAVQHFCRENAVEVDQDSQVVFDVNPMTFPQFQVDRAHKKEAFDQLIKAIERGVIRNKAASATLRDLFEEKFPEEHFWKTQEDQV